MKDKRCHKYDKINHFVDCSNNKVSIKASHICIANRMLEGGFVAKATIVEKLSFMIILYHFGCVISNNCVNWDPSF